MIALALAALGFAVPAAVGQPLLGGALSGSPPGPLFPADNWWSADVSSAPVDPGSASYIQFINGCPNCCPSGGQGLHPDFGGDVAPGSVHTYGVPYAVVDGTQPKRSVIFYYSTQSDGVNHATNTSFPFYPLPDEAITQPHWVEGGDPGSVDLRSQQDRHLIVVNRDHRHLYELWNVWYDSAHDQWYAGSGAFFDMNMNNRRPETWTSGDAAGLAMLPGLVRYDEVFYADATGAYEIPHAFRVTVRATNGYVYPASHSAGDTIGALPMGARLRLKAGKDISGFPPPIQRIFKAMKNYGLLVADNGTDMYVTGTYDTRWDNDVLNPAFAQLTACDFEVVQLGWRPQPRSRILGDFNGDGRADILWRHTSGTVVMWLLNGTNVIGAGVPGDVSTQWTIVDVGDFNGDGKADILWRHASGSVAVWLLNGTSVIGSGIVGSAPSDWAIAGVGDFNGDGKADILLRNSAGTVVVWLLNGTSVVGTGSPGGASPDWTIVAAADFNRDGRADILWRHATGTVAVWLMNGTALTAAGVLGSAPTDWTIAGTGDIDGDGRADIVWRHSTGIVAAWLVNGTGIAGTGVVGNVTSDWHLAGVGDLNGDGRADILWRNSAGLLAEWLLNGTNIVGTGSPGAATTDWQIQ
jgi:hypothetical protein